MKKMKINNIWSLVVIAFTLLSSCDTYLDVVPDNLATIENAFSMRTNAEKYLFTCYSYMPRHADVESNLGLLAGDEIWAYDGAAAGNAGREDFDHDMFDIALGQQNKINPLGNSIWDNMYKAIRDCNIFIETIDIVPDMDELEKREWKAEVKFLKAYYHFFLIKHYGPIPIIDESLPIDATIEEVRVSREPVEDCFDFVIQLLDDSLENIPENIIDPLSDLGRITKPVVLSLKANVLVYYASPLFNGNNDFAALKNNDGTPLFSQVYDENRWVTAAAACKEAIEVCESLGLELHEYQNTIGKDLSDATITQLSLRNSFTEKWNNEVIWANNQSLVTNIQRFSSPFVNESNTDNTEIRHELGVPIKISDQYYSENGVPINEDNSWNYNDRYSTKVATSDDFPNIKTNYETTSYHFNRENRYYANVAFDGGIWYGQGKYDENDLFYIRTKRSEPNNGGSMGSYIKKYVHYENVQTPPKGYSVNSYPWPIFRLADLYLLYAEALNEANGPVDEAKIYLNRVRDRAGLNGVDESWSNFSSNPSKPQSKEGLREIIQQERLIELAYEGKRYFDIRRWKTAPTVMNNDVLDWDQTKEESDQYSIPRIIFTQKFGTKDYFMPIKDSYIIRNRNLVQNLGW